MKFCWKALICRVSCKEMLRSHFVDFATDGAAARMGPYRGAAALLCLREKVNQKPSVIHCMTHKLEPAACVAVKMLQR